MVSTTLPNYYEMVVVVERDHDALGVPELQFSVGGKSVDYSG